MDYQGQATALAPPPAARPLLLPPAAPLFAAVEAAIDRKAHTLSLDCFTHNRAILADWVRREGGDSGDPAAAIERIHALDLDHGKHVLVDLQLLHDLTSTARTLQRTSDLQMQAITRIETATKRQLQG